MKDKIEKQYPIKNEEIQFMSEPLTTFMPTSFIKNNVLNFLTTSTKDLFTSVAVNTGLTIKSLAENIFEITPKTFIKYKNNESKIPSRIAEIAIEINILYKLGNEIFGSAENFNGWLNKENIYFKNYKPSKFLNTSTGIHFIYEEIKRIEFGATA